MTITIQDQIKAVAREIALRERVYPKWIAQKKMGEEMADREIKLMHAVLATLMELRKEKGL